MIVLDLLQVREIEGAGVGVLLFLRRWADRHNIQFKLFNPTRSVWDRLVLVSPIAKFHISTLQEMRELLANKDSD